MTDTESETRECPYCEWSIDTDDLLFDDPHVLDHRADLHYEREHCGEVRVTVTVDRTLPLHPGQSTEQLRSHMLDLVEGELRGFEVAYASTEITDEPAEALDDE